MCFNFKLSKSLSNFVQWLENGGYRGYGELGAGDVPRGLSVGGPRELTESAQTAGSLGSGARTGSPVVRQPRHYG